MFISVRVEKQVSIEGFDELSERIKPQVQELAQKASARLSQNLFKIDKLYVHTLDVSCRTDHAGQGRLYIIAVPPRLSNDLNPLSEMGFETLPRGLIMRLTENKGAPKLPWSKEPWLDNQLVFESPWFK